MIEISRSIKTKTKYSAGSYVLFRDSSTKEEYFALIMEADNEYDREYYDEAMCKKINRESDIPVIKYYLPSDTVVYDVVAFNLKELNDNLYNTNTTKIRHFLITEDEIVFSLGDSTVQKIYIALHNESDRYERKVCDDI